MINETSIILLQYHRVTVPCLGHIMLETYHKHVEGGRYSLSDFQVTTVEIYHSGYQVTMVPLWHHH